MTAVFSGVFWEIFFFETAFSEADVLAICEDEVCGPVDWVALLVPLAAIFAHCLLCERHAFFWQSLHQSIPPKNYSTSKALSRVFYREQ